MLQITWFALTSEVLSIPSLRIPLEMLTFSNKGNRGGKHGKSNCRRTDRRYGPKTSDVPRDAGGIRADPVRGDGDGEVLTVRSGNPKGDLGRLAIVRGLHAPRKLMALREESPMRQHAHAIALMRPVELVVRYLPGEAFADSRFEWAGVFICSKEDEIEKAFAVSEPPAHDDWIPDMLPKGRSKTFVNVALRELKMAAATYVQTKAALGAGEERGPSVASTAAKLGKLLSSTSGKGPGRSISHRGGGRKKITITSPRFVGLEFHDGQCIARFEAVLTNDGSRPDLTLHASPHLVLDGSSTSIDDLPGEISITFVDLSLGDKITETGGLGSRRSKEQSPAG